MAHNPPQFSLVKGGPFNALLIRLKLVGTDQLPGWRGALLLAAFAWVPPAILCLVDWLYYGDGAALSYFIDHTAYIRWLLAITVMVLVERTADQRLTPIVNQFTAAKLVTGESAEEFHRLVRRADERTASAIAEVVLVVAVITIAFIGTTLDIEIGGFNWDGRVVGGEAEYTLAGLWSHWIAKPLFQFLLLRWFWRFGVWGWLLFRISRLKLNLIGYHPDRSGGLGFLSIYPTVFSGLIFAMSALVASQLISEAHRIDMAVELQRALMLGWLVVVILVFIGPLALFTVPLQRLRERTIFEMGIVASEHHAAFNEKWFSDETTGKDLLGSEEIGSTADLDVVAAAPFDLRILPLKLATTVALLVSAGTPLLVVLATQMPLDQFVSYIVSAVF